MLYTGKITIHKLLNEKCANIQTAELSGILTTRPTHLGILLIKNWPVHCTNQQHFIYSVAVFLLCSSLTLTDWFLDIIGAFVKAAFNASAFFFLKQC